MTTVHLPNGTAWEFRGVTPGGMARLWAIDGGASLTWPLDEIEGLREMARPLLAQRSSEYDRDDWQTMPIEGIREIIATHYGTELIA